MEASLWVALAVAVIAAGASVFAAWRSDGSARRAQAIAEGQDRRRHLVEALDAETDSFRSALTEFLHAIGEAMTNGQLMTGVLTVTVRAEVLRTHPLTSADLDAAIDGLIASLYSIAQDPGKHAKKPTRSYVHDVRKAVRAILEAQGMERRRLIGALPE